MPRVFGRLLLGLALAWGVPAHAQENPAPPQQLQPPPNPIPEGTVLNPRAPCVQPPPVVSWEDYEGPLQKVVGAVGRRLDRKSVHAPHYKPGAIICSLTLSGKFLLFADDLYDPITFLSAGFDSGIDQAEDNERKFGQGAQGYGKRFGFNYAQQASSEFFSDVVYSTIFTEDPRYYRQIHGSAKSRFFHAVEHTVVAKKEDGTDEFNFCEWLGKASSIALSRAYATGARPGFAPAAEGFGVGLAQDAGWNVLREFWPEIAHKFKLPFRDQHEPMAPQSAQAPTF